MCIRDRSLRSGALLLGDTLAISGTAAMLIGGPRGFFPPVACAASGSEEDTRVCIPLEELRNADVDM
eukprot:3934164-Alexandrium_andersonii.AAC.1